MPGQAKGELLVTLLMPDLGLSRLLPVWPLVFFLCGLNTLLCSQLRKTEIRTKSALSAGTRSSSSAFSSRLIYS